MSGVDNREDGSRGWTSRSVGSKLQHAIFYRLIRLKARWIISLLLRAVVSYYVCFRPALRNRSSYYISRRFPGSSAFRRLRAAYLLDLSLGQTLLDRATLGIIGPDSVRVSFPEHERLAALVGERKGVMLLTAHVGGWQVAMAALRFLEVPINLLLYRDEADVDRHYFEHRGSASPFGIIDPKEPMGGMLSAMEVLKKGEVLCVMGDRAFGSSRSTVVTRFLGDPITIPFSAFKIASVTGSPVAVIFSHRMGQGAYELTLDRVIRVPGGLGRSGVEFVPYVNQFVTGMEAFVTAHPFQFFNFFDMWRNDGPAPEEREEVRRRARRRA